MRTHMEGYLCEDYTYPHLISFGTFSAEEHNDDLQIAGKVFRTCRS